MTKQSMLCLIRQYFVKDFVVILAHEKKNNSTK